MSVEPANDNTAVGSVRRFADDRSVTLHIDGSRNALFGAAMFACVPVGCFTLTAGLFVAALNDLGGAVSTLTLACLLIGGLGITVFPAFAIVPFIRGLVRTALRRVTFDADAAQLRLLAFGYGPPVCLTWRREVIRDILVHTRGAGLYELRIVLARQPPVSLLYGVRREELDFIASELRRALRVDARVRSVAGWWGDQAGEARADDGKSSAAAHSAALLDYAPEPKEHGAAERSTFRARVFIPPPSVGDLIRRRKWSLLTTCVALAIVIPVQLLVVRQSSRATLSMYIGILVLLDLVAFLECVRYRSVEVDAARVTVTTRLPLLGEKVRTWPAETVADIAARGKNLELHLRDGTRRTLVTLATPAAAENVARSLRPGPSDA